MDARRQHEKAFAQSERACVGGLCEVSPRAVLVRRQPFIGPVGRGCRMGCQLHVNFTRATGTYTDQYAQLSAVPEILQQT